MADAENGFRVLVIGAGSAGLLIAQGLKKIGIPCKVFEQDSALGARPRDWNFGIYWAQSKVRECLPNDLYDRLEGTQVDCWTPGPNDVLPLYHGGNGQLMTAMPSPLTLRPQRRKFQQLIATGIDIHYSKRIVQIEMDESSATAVFEDGSKENANLIIGADGARSVVRDILLGPEKAALQMSPIVGSFCLARLPAASSQLISEIHPRFAVAVHPAGYTLWIGVHAKYDDTKPGDGIYMVILTWKSERDTKELQGPAILVDLKERASKFAEPFKTALLSIPDDTICWHNRLSSWPSEKWDNRNGTVTLAGDAAHPMTFHRGQGLNNALDDAAQLVQQLGSLFPKPTPSQSPPPSPSSSTSKFTSPSPSPPPSLSSSSTFQSTSPSFALNPNKSPAAAAAIAAYDAEVQTRGKQAVLSSLENSLMLHDWERMTMSMTYRKGMSKDEVS